MPFSFGGLGVYTALDVLHYAFVASRLQSAGLQAKLLGPSGITSLGPIFYDARALFAETTDSDVLSNPSEIAAPKLMKKMAYIYFTPFHHQLSIYILLFLFLVSLRRSLINCFLISVLEVAVGSISKINPCLNST